MGRLSREFEKAASEFHDFYIDTFHHSCSLQNKAGHSDATPFFRPSVWNSNAGLNNCYNFALDYRNDSYLQPGDLHAAFVGGKEGRMMLIKSRREDWSRLSLGKYTDRIISRAQNDGLVYLGKEPRPLEDSFPVALFVKKNKDHIHDFHWFALRRRLNAVFETQAGWFHKAGRSKVMDSGKESIFSYAKEEGYRHFVGYFAVNKENLKMP